MILPEDCYLAYIVPHEAWWRDVVTNDPPTVLVMASSRGGGVAWEFRVEERDISGGCLELNMFSDSWEAFEQIPEFFTALHEKQPQTLTELRELLDNLGARDSTERSNQKQEPSRTDEVHTAEAAVAAEFYSFAAELSKIARSEGFNADPARRRAFAEIIAMARTHAGDPAVDLPQHI